MCWSVDLVPFVIVEAFKFSKLKISLSIKCLHPNFLNILHDILLEYCKSFDKYEWQHFLNNMLEPL